MYALLKIILRFTLYAYFRKVKIEGKDKISKNGPYILISNHPSAFMDPIVVAANIKPTIYFLAGGEYLGKGFRYWIMSRFLNIIPIYRPETMPNHTHHNTSIFDKCIAHLNRRKSILVFPEGVSSKGKKVFPLKTGVARIVRATEIAYGMKANVQIIPIGLNYSDPHKFRSDLFINVGEPIQASDYFTDDPDKSIEEVRAFTQLMEEKLIQTVLHIENQEFEDLLSKVNETYMRDLKSELDVNFSDQRKEFELNQLIISAFKYFQQKSPEKFNQMKAKIDAYFEVLNSHKIKDRELRKVDTKANFSQNIFLFLGAPFYLLGYFGNFIPYTISKALQKKFNVKETFRGSIILSVGMIMFILWYVVVVLSVWQLTTYGYFSLLIPLVLYPLGIHSLIYSSVFKYLKRRKKLRKYFESNEILKQQLLKSRQELITDFKLLHADFDARN